MQRVGEHDRLDEAQREMAVRGLKGLIPFRGRPFLDYGLEALADAGFGEACLVVRPGRDPIREAFQARAGGRLTLRFAVQQEPRGSAHALLAAEGFAAGEPIVVVNADNLYPAATLEAVRRLDGSGLAGFREEVLAAGGGIPLSRIAGYALALADARGFLTRIVEKPDPATLRQLRSRASVSMTCWRFRPAIFTACRAIGPSARGEYELPDAVSYALATLGEPFRVLPSDEPVLDLSEPDDVAIVAARLEERRAGP